MKNLLIDFFDLEEGELETKDVAAAGISLFVALGFVFLPLFL